MKGVVLEDGVLGDIGKRGALVARVLAAGVIMFVIVTMMGIATVLASRP